MLGRFFSVWQEGVARLPNSHCCNLGWVWAAWRLRPPDSLRLSSVGLFGSGGVNIKIAREAELPSDFTFVDCEIVYCTSTVYHRRACLSSGLSQESKIFCSARKRREGMKKAQRQNSLRTLCNLDTMLSCEKLGNFMCSV